MSEGALAVALLEPRRVPGQIDIDEIMASHLKVDPFARGVGADQDGEGPRQGVRAAAWTKPEPESLPRKRSPIWSCVRATDRRSLLPEAPDRFGGEADDDFGRDTFATADAAGEAVFGVEAEPPPGLAARPTTNLYSVRAVSRARRARLRSALGLKPPSSQRTERQMEAMGPS